MRAPPTLRSGRLLVVDDEPLILELLREFFGRGGHVVHTAPDGREAESLARENEYDLILMDVRLPGSSGPETARRIARFREQVPFVFMTGFGALGEHEAVPARTIAVVDKPLDLAGLDLIVRTSLAGVA